MWIVRQVKPPGPGLAEAIGWMASVWVVQLVGFAAVVFLLVVLSSDLQGKLQLSQLRMEDLIERNLIPAIGGPLLAFVIFAIIAAPLRLGKGSRRKIALQSIPLNHFGLILLSILPMALLSGALMHSTGLFWEWLQQTDYWQSVRQTLPFLQLFEQQSSMDAVDQLIGQTSPMLMIMMFAVAPAISEELIFRGIIGRGLIARWGLVGGMLCTTALFALLHMNLAHVLALIPLGFFLHFVYYVSRSFWAPVMLHFCNNAWAVIALTFIANPEESAAVDSVSLQLILTASLTVTLIACWMWICRVRYLLPDGTEWSPGYASLELPDADADVQMTRGTAPGWLKGLSLASFGLFLLSYLQY